MTDELAKSHSVKVSKVIPAPRAQVFEAWVVPSLRRQWWTCGTCDVCEIDARKGGVFRIGTSDDGNGESHIATGAFMEFDPPHRLVFSWTWEQQPDMAKDTHVTVDFIEDKEHTRVELTHDRFDSAKQAKPHYKGWEYGFCALARIMKNPPSLKSVQEKQPENINAQGNESC